MGLRYLEDLNVGMQAELSRVLDDAAVRAFADVSGDTNPLHLDEAFAKDGPFRQRIAHGAHVASLVSAVMGVELPGPGAIYMSQTVQFLRPVRIGDTVRAQVTVAAISPETKQVTLACACLVGSRTVMRGEAIVRMASRAERGS